MHKAIAVALLLCAAACKGDKPAPAPAKLALADAAPLVDPSRPYLSEDALRRFVQSMQDDGNPFAFLFDQKSERPGLDPAGVAALDTFAKKYGFAGAEDYFQIWTRIMLAEMGELAGSAKQMGDDAMKLLEQRLASPDLTPEERRDLERQLGEVKQQFTAEDRRDQQAALNAQDTALIQRFRNDLDAALARWTR